MFGKFLNEQTHKHAHESLVLELYDHDHKNSVIHDHDCNHKICEPLGAYPTFGIMIMKHKVKTVIMIIRIHKFFALVLFLCL